MSPTDYKHIGEREKGDPNILPLKEINRIRPLDNLVAGWKQHGIEHPSDPEQFSSVVCPGARSCPLCRKPVDAQGNQRFPISRRYAANTWDYDTSSVKVLVGGPQIFDKFKEAATVGIEPSSCDWTITKSGQRRQTTYAVIRHDAEPFSAAVITPEMLHSVDKYEQATSTEAIFEILERFGIDYDELEVPSYTYDEALAFVIPYTKHKGLTVEQLLQKEPEYASWMHGTKLEQGQLGDPLFLALQTAMQERGLVPSLEEAIEMLPTTEDAPPEQRVIGVGTSTAAPAVDLSPASAGLVKLISPDGEEVMVPPSVVESMLVVEFRRPEPEPTTSSDADAPMRVAINGNEVELPREQALMLIEAGTATAADAAPVEPEAPALPLPDEIVSVVVGGVPVPMPYVQAAQVVDNPASGAMFADEKVVEAHAISKARELAGQAADPTGTPAPESASTRTHDPEKPFECDQCNAAYKTQGALTQHKNREHKAAEPQPSAVPSAGSNGDLDERLKDKIARAPFARDYTRLIKIFEEEVGEKNYANMSDEQKTKLEARIDREIAAAAS